MTDSFLSPLKYKIAYAIVWWAIFQLQSMVLYQMGWGLKVALVDSLVCNALLLIASLIVMQILRYYIPSQNKIVLLIIWGGLLVFLVALFSHVILLSVFSANEKYVLFTQQAIILRVSFYVLIIFCSILLMMIWSKFQSEKEQQNQKAESEKLLREAELFSLRQQTQPHFLFNSLNSINALVSTNPLQARKMIQQLSDFLRGTIAKSGNYFISVKEEIKHLELYLSIEKIRFADRLSVEINMTEEILEEKMPALLLQPIVENAIKFGLYGITEKTVITISGIKKENYLIFEIINPFDKETANTNKGTGFGLPSIQRRLSLIFGRNDLLQYYHEENLFHTTIKIPKND